MPTWTLRYTTPASRAQRKEKELKRARYSNGSVVFDRRRKTWNFLQWINGKRRSKVIGTKQEFPTKALARKAAESLKASVQGSSCTLPTVLTMSTLVEQYRAEKMPARASTKRG